LRHGDIFGTRLPSQSADLVVVHQVLHYLSDPAAAVAEAARLVSPNGRLVIIDFAPHDFEHMREAHQHRRLGFADSEISSWLTSASLTPLAPIALPPEPKDGAGRLTVTIWTAERRAEQNRRTA
jgi:ArsR family transcriptional regulator